MPVSVTGRIHYEGYTIKLSVCLSMVAMRRKKKKISLYIYSHARSSSWILIRGLAN